MAQDTYARINLEDYFQTGEGGTSLTYNKKDGTSLAKLFSPGLLADTAAREFRISRVVYDLGIPSPRPIRLITDGERFGAEYELIAPKRSFARIIADEPEQLEALSLRFAELTASMHQTKADTQVLPSMRELMRAWVPEHKDILSDEHYGAFMAFLDSLPEPGTCLHGDLHIGNIIRTTGRDLWIDLGDFAHGVPEWDLGMMYFASSGFGRGDERTMQIFHNTVDTMQRHWAIFIRAYLGTDDKKIIREKEASLQPFIACKLFYYITKLGYGTSPFLSESLDKMLMGK